MSARTGHPQHQRVAGCVAGAGLEEEVEHPRIVRPIQLRNKQPDLILIVLDGGRYLPCTQAAPYTPSPPCMHVNTLLNSSSLALQTLELRHLTHKRPVWRPSRSRARLEVAGDPPRLRAPAAPGGPQPGPQGRLHQPPDIPPPRARCGGHQARQHARDAGDPGPACGVHGGPRAPPLLRPGPGSARPSDIHRLCRTGPEQVRRLGLGMVDAAGRGAERASSGGEEGEEGED